MIKTVKLGPASFVYQQSFSFCFFEIKIKCVSVSKENGVTTIFLQFTRVLLKMYYWSMQGHADFAILKKNFFYAQNLAP